MKKLLNNLFKGPAPEQAATNNQPTTQAAPKLNPQLSKKDKNRGVFPGSFFHREQKFKAEVDAAKAAEAAVVPPRSEGSCQIKHGRFGTWTSATCQLKGSQLHIQPSPATSETDTSNSSFSSSSSPTPLQQPKVVKLVGSHLASCKVPEEITLTDGTGSTAFFRFPNPSERDQWMVALGKVPGIFRRVEDYYVLGKTWGVGATSEVQECIGRFTGRRLALKKRLHTTREATEAMHNELRILQLCAKHPHPAIPTLEDYFFDPSGKIELVMQLMEGGELFDWIVSKDRLTEAEARAVFAQIVTGVAHLHTLGIAHRDLKPQNLMYVAASEGAAGGASIKIMDYDLARVDYSPEWKGSTPCGTAHYQAPEIVAGQKYSLAVDCWSLGVILYILLTGCVPFDGGTTHSVHRAISGGSYSLEGAMWEGVSDEAEDLVKKLLTMDPSLRCTADQALHHPWLIARLDQQQDITSNGSAAGISTALSARRSTTTERDLKTIENLRRLESSSGSLISNHSSGALGGRGGVLGDANAIPLATINKTSSSVSGSQVLASPLSKALNYDLGPVRRQAAALAGEGEQEEEGLNGADRNILYKTASRDSLQGGEKSARLSQVKVALDLVGTQAGIQDSRAGSLAHGFCSGSPVDNTSFLGGGGDSIDDEFAGLGVSFVEEEDEVGGHGGGGGGGGQ